MESFEQILGAMERAYAPEILGEGRFPDDDQFLPNATLLPPKYLKDGSVSRSIKPTHPGIVRAEIRNSRGLKNFTLSFEGIEAYNNRKNGLIVSTVERGGKMLLTSEAGLPNAGIISAQSLYDGESGNLEKLWIFNNADAHRGQYIYILESSQEQEISPHQVTHWSLNADFQAYWNTVTFSPKILDDNQVYWRAKVQIGEPWVQMLISSSPIVGYSYSFLIPAKFNSTTFSSLLKRYLKSTLSGRSSSGLQ